MVGQQIDVMRQQQRQTLPHPASNAAILATPKQAMVHKDGVGLRCNGRLNQGQTGRYTRNDFLHLHAPFHLQAVGAVVTKALRLQQGITSGQELVAVGHGKSCVESFERVRRHRIMA